MAITQQRRLTLEEFLELPEEKPAFEYVEGVVSQKVSPQGEHSVVQYGFAEHVNRFARPKKLAWAFPELRATWAGASPVPDVSVYRWERIPRTPAGRVANVFREPPDIAVEIRSPGQRRAGQVERCRWYVAHGVLIALLADPRDESVTRFQEGTPERVLRGSDRIDLDDVLPGFELTVKDLFGALDLD